MRDNSLAHLAHRSSRLSLSVSRLDDGVLLRRLARLVARDRVTTAALLAHIAEVDARRLYAPAGYPSMHAYCVGELRLSEDAAWKRIQAARAARRVPALLGALAEGRLHLSAVCLLAPHVGGENAEELIEAATHRSKAEIEAMLLRRLASMEALQLAPGQVGDGSHGVDSLAPGRVGDGSHGVDSLAPGQVSGKGSGPIVASGSLAPGQVVEWWGTSASPLLERVSLHVSISKTTQEKLRYAQALLSHAVPSGDPAEVLDRALDVLIGQLERRRFGAGGGGSHPRRTTVTAERREALTERGSSRDRYIPARVRREVWERDGGRCTFVGTNGRRCGAGRFLEFDHAEPVARGGRATVEGIRLRCRTHNQYEAERVFGAGFMEAKRRQARRAHAMPARTPALRAPARGHGLGAQHDEQLRDIQACLRRLGYRSDEARCAAEHAATASAPTLEERLRAALQFLGRRSGALCRVVPPPGVGSKAEARLTSSPG